jgi:hypothetical protein
VLAQTVRNSNIETTFERSINIHQVADDHVQVMPLLAKELPCAGESYLAKVDGVADTAKAGKGQEKATASSSELDDRHAWSKLQLLLQ